MTVNNSKSAHELFLSVKDKLGNTKGQYAILCDADDNMIDVVPFDINSNEFNKQIQDMYSNGVSGIIVILYEPSEYSFITVKDYNSCIEIYDRMSTTDIVYRDYIKTNGNEYYSCAESPIENI